MEINTNFDERVAVHFDANPWVASPMAGVDRRMLDRIGSEVARATTIVRFAPGSHFSPHTHDGGEEFLVLDGVFQDEHGDFPVGSYLRNPPTTSHTPRSDEGCTIFVKLWQFNLDDRTEVKLRPGDQDFKAAEENTAISRCLLHQDKDETVTIERWKAGSEIALHSPDGLEALLLEGRFEEAGEGFQKHSWLRLPKGSSTLVKVGEEGARLWIKRHHLAKPPMAPRKT